MPVLLILFWVGWTGLLEVLDTVELVPILTPLDAFKVFVGFDKVVLGCLNECFFSLVIIFAFCF